MSHTGPEFWRSVGKEVITVSERDHEVYYRLLLAAKEAHSDPYQSGFHVLTAALTADGQIVTGGNKENSLSDAFAHGETAVISRTRDTYGDVPIKAIAIYSDQEGTSACPCGNCRDVMRMYCEPDMVLIEGNEHNGVISRFSDYLFDDFHPVESEELHDTRGLAEANRAIRQGVSVYLPPKLKEQIYGVSLVTKDGQVWPGSFYTNAGYDAIPPLLASIQTWRNMLPFSDRDKDKHLAIEKIVIASIDGTPDVLYRDRQAALELDEVLRQHDSERTNPLPIFLMNVDASGQIQTIHTTNTEEWLPHPFSPKSFGMEDALQAQVMLYLADERQERDRSDEN